MAHWQFAFEYFKLSYKTKLRNDNRPVDTNLSLLNAINFTVSATITLLAASVALTSAFGYVDVGNILASILNSFLVIALLFMSYGLWVLTKIAKLNDTQANAGTMSIHIVAYLLCILAKYSYYIKHNSVKAIEISSISYLITNLFSSLMLAWVVYKLN